MLFYILIPLCIVWILSYLILWFKGHYPVQFVHIHLLIFVCTFWMCFAVWSLPETPLLWVGLVMAIVSSILCVPAILSLVQDETVFRKRLWGILMLFQVVGYFVLCVAFCVLETAGTACICGGCLVLAFVYVDKIYNSSDSSDLNNALLSISI